MTPAMSSCRASRDRKSRLGAQQQGDATIDMFKQAISGESNLGSKHNKMSGYEGRVTNNLQVMGVGEKGRDEVTLWGRTMGL